MLLVDYMKHLILLIDIWKENKNVYITSSDSWYINFTFLNINSDHEKIKCSIIKERFYYE